MSLNNTHRMYSCISSAKWLRERATTVRYTYIAYLVRRTFLFSLTLCDIPSFLTRSVQLNVSILLQHHISKLSGNFWCTFRNVQGAASYKAVLQMQHFTSFLLKLKSNLLVKRIFLLNFASVLAILDWVYREIIAVCYEIHTGHIHNTDRMENF